MAVNSTGEWLAFGCKGLGQLLVWEWQSETYVLKQQGHFYDMNTLAYSPDGQLVATGGDDCKVGGGEGWVVQYIHVYTWVSITTLIPNCDSQHLEYVTRVLMIQFKGFFDFLIA